MQSLQEVSINTLNRQRCEHLFLQYFDYTAAAAAAALPAAAAAVPPPKALPTVYVLLLTAL
jgi:hypothetical protein